MGVSLSQIKSEFLTELGDGYVNVEITDDQFNNAVKFTKRWFIAKKGFTVWRPLSLVDGQSEYKMKSDVLNVLDVAFQVPSDVAAFFTLGFFDIIPFGPNTLMSVGSGLTNYSGFAQLLQFTEQRKRVFSVEPDWSFDHQNRILRVYKRPGNMTDTALMWVKLNDVDPQCLHEKDEDIFSRYLKAKCKEIVGRSRSKYDSLPGANGPVTLDGRALIDEAKEEMKDLDQLIFASQGPDLPMLA